MKGEENAPDFGFPLTANKGDEEHKLSDDETNEKIERKNLFNQHGYKSFRIRVSVKDHFLTFATRGVFSFSYYAHHACRMAAGLPLIMGNLRGIQFSRLRFGKAQEELHTHSTGSATGRVRCSGHNGSV